MTEFEIRELARESRKPMSLSKRGVTRMGVGCIELKGKAGISGLVLMSPSWCRCRSNIRISMQWRRDDLKRESSITSYSTMSGLASRNLSTYSELIVH